MNWTKTRCLSILFPLLAGGFISSACKKTVETKEIGASQGGEANPIIVTQNPGEGEEFGEISISSSPETSLSFVKNNPGERKLNLVIRDFKASHPDFETEAFKAPPGMENVAVKGLVKADLSDGGKPIFNDGFNGTPRITSQNSLAQWYTDVNGVNIKVPYEITLQKVGNTNVYTYANNLFFPIDNQGFAAQNEPQLPDTNNVQRNFHFTAEIENSFTYQGGEEFTFTGDDDVWVFINKKLVVDLGGLHGEVSETVKLDDLGLEKGKVYPFKMFFAERHTNQSNFRIDTSLELQENEPFLYQLEIEETRPDLSSPLRYELTTAPSGMIVDDAGLISWLPTESQIGSNPVTVVVTGAAGSTASQSFTVVVEEKAP